MLSQIPRDATSRHVARRHATPCHTMAHHATPRHIMPFHAVSRHAMPCHAIPFHATSCRVMPRRGSAFFFAALACALAVWACFCSSRAACCWVRVCSSRAACFDRLVLPGCLPLSACRLSRIRDRALDIFRHALSFCYGVSRRIATTSLPPKKKHNDAH